MISGISSAVAFGFDRVRFSTASPRQEEAEVGVASSPEQEGGTSSMQGTGSDAQSAKEADEQALDTAEIRLIEQLVAADRKVRAHEMAHVSAGGDIVQGGANFDYQTGPDGKRYAVGGEVSIDSSKGRTPEETVAKAQRIRAAALAPADPSPQDNRVAASATRMEMEARQELALQQSQSSSGAEGERAEPSMRGRSAVQAYLAQTLPDGAANATRFRAIA